jgi:hypothetical protein
VPFKRSVILIIFCHCFSSCMATLIFSSCWSHYWTFSSSSKMIQIFAVMSNIYVMHENRWQTHGARPISIWESVRELNGGSHSRYFEVRLNSAPELIFGAHLKSGWENLEARLDDYERNGRLHYGSGMRLV